MKRLCSKLFALWMGFSLGFSLWAMVQDFALPWLGVALSAAAPLVNRLWPFDRGFSLNMKVKMPLVSLFVMLGVAWVLLTVPERGWPLWLVLGTLGSFLLDTYWASSDDVSS